MSDRRRPLGKRTQPLLFSAQRWHICPHPFPWSALWRAFLRWGQARGLSPSLSGNVRLKNDNPSGALDKYDEGIYIMDTRRPAIEVDRVGFSCGLRVTRLGLGHVLVC